MYTVCRSCFAIICILIMLLIFSNAEYRRECRKQTKVLIPTLQKLKDGQFEENQPQLKCYLHCIMKKNGIFNKKNEIDVDNAIRHLPTVKLQKVSREILQRCKSFDHNDPCEKAFKIAKCYFKAQPEVLKYI